MMKPKRKPVVRVVVFKPTDDRTCQCYRAGLPDGILLGFNIEMFLEMLRRAGVVNVLFDDERKIVFDVHPPKQMTRPEEWARTTAACFRSYNVNAVSANALEPHTR